ncbi:Ycf48-like protein [compost metagenome]
MLLSGWALMLLVWPATADVDLLSLPAMKSEKATGAIMLAANHAGERIVVAGERGIILYSDDDGRSWSQADVPVSVTLTALHFLNEHSGWAVGHDGVVLHSGDGGRSWSKQVDGYRLNEIVRADAEELVRQARSSIEVAGGETEESLQALEQAEFILDDVMAGAQFGPSRPLLGVWFDNANDGYVVGANGQIFLTRDGGGTWMSAARRLNNPEALHYNGIVVGEGGDKFLAGEGGKVYRSHADGTWQTFDTGYSGALYGVLPLKDDAGSEILLAYGFGGNILRSMDGGETWTRIETKDKVATLVSAQRMDSGEVLLLAQDGSLLESDDAGLTFTARRSASGMRVAAMVRLAEGHALLMTGIGGVHRVDLDAGETESRDITE